MHATMTARSFLRWAAGICMMFATLPAQAQDLAPALGPLAPSVALGASGSWTVLTERGRVVLSDADDAGAVRFYSTAWQGDRSAGRSAGARVLATGMGSAAAGLVYNVQDGFPRWSALMVTADKSVAVYARQPSGLMEIKRVPIPGGPHADGELLQISERAGITAMFANGVEIIRFNMAANNPVPPDQPVGILAVGPGRFAFRDFAFGQEVVAHGAGDDRVPARTGPVAGNDDRVPPPSSTPASTRGPTAEARRWPVPQLDPLAANVLGASMGILAHEFGHFMIGELKIPATGPEEDVADEFAAMVFVDNMRDMPEAAGNMALSMAKFWWYTADDRGDDHQPPWFDEHAPDRARFARVMCMLYGAAPQMFEDVMQQTGIPERTRARCIDDERKRHLAWDGLLRSHRRRGVDPVMPGDLEPGTPGHRVTVEYHPPADPRYGQLMTFMQRSRMLETAADLLSKLYVLPRDTKIVVRDCNETNCFYNPQDGSVTMCYEMLAFVATQFAQHEGTSGQVADQKPAPAPTPVSAPRPATPVAGATFNLAQFLAGTWRLQQIDGQTTDDILVQPSPDGSYRARHSITLPNKDSIVIGVAGRWSAEPLASDRTFDLTLTPQQWTPQQICAKDGSCEPLQLDPTRATVKIQDRNTLTSDQGRATRIQ